MFLWLLYKRELEHGLRRNKIVKYKNLKNQQSVKEE